MGEEALAELHHAVVVGVGLVELDHRELGVVADVDALVAEVLAHLVDALHAADDAALEVELGRDAEIELEIEGVGLGHEGAGRRPRGDGREHWGLDLEEAARVEVLAYRGYD